MFKTWSCFNMLKNYPNGPDLFDFFASPYCQLYIIVDNIISSLICIIILSTNYQLMAKNINLKY